MERRVLRIGAVAAALTALLALGAATASARTSLAPSLRLRARALQRAQALPHAFSLTTVFMQTAPVAVVRNGVTNNMTLSVFGDPAFGSSAIDVTLAKAQPDGRAFQEHDYSFSPQSGIQFRFDKKGLETATLDTTTAITPSQITGSFTATSVKARNCRLFDGRHTTRLAAKGTVAWSAFDVETSTSPFFGAIRTQPTHAKIVKDPGCNTDVIVFSSGATARAVRAIPKVDSAIGAPAYSERRDQPCFFNRALGAKVGPGRFEAVVHGAGGEFLNGTATFTSGPPAVARGLACRAGGRLRPFTRLTYRGTLDPTPAAPLVASFDTLPLALREGTPATYVVREYGRHAGE